MRTWPVDPRNAAEVLACAGIAHLAWREDRGAATGFVTHTEDGVRFVAPDVPALDDPEALPLEQVAGAAGALRLGGVVLDWWRPWGLNPALKLWAGNQSAWTVHGSLRAAAGDASPAQWLTFTAPATGRLALDPGATWSAQALGWSVTRHPKMRMHCRPWLELLASLGLEAFPVAGHRARGGFHFNLWRPAPLGAALAAFAGPCSPTYALARYHAGTQKSGENSMLRLATPVAGGGTH